MRKMNLLIGILGMLALASAAFGAEIADIAWDQSNLETLHSFDKAAVARFLNSGLVQRPFTGRVNPDNDEEFDIVRAGDVEGFSWANLSGNNQYQLVVVFQPLGSSGANSMAIYNRDSSGKISEQEIQGHGIQLEGWKDRPYIPKVIQDLNGDGKDELVIPVQLGSGIYGAAPVAIWPKVYRLQNGKYVEASRDFAKFYDTQVLPELNSEIADAREGAARELQSEPGARMINRGQKMMLDAAIITRDKILRVIGRDPKAGEQQAREWVTGPDPDPWNAAIVFGDMGGHEEDLLAAKLALKREVDAARKALSERK